MSLTLWEARLFPASPPKSAGSCERKLARITQDQHTVVIVGESCASPFRRSTWSSACLVPGVDDAYDDVNNPSDFKINSTCRVSGSI